MTTEQPKKHRTLGTILKAIGVAIIGVLAYIFLGKWMNENGKINNERIDQAEKKIDDEKKRLAGMPTDTDIKDKHSKIITPVLILAFLFTYGLRAEYVVYDKEEGVHRDYGTVENYAEAQNELYMTNKAKVRSLSVITNQQAIVIHELKEDLKEEKRERARIHLKAYATAVVAVVVFIAGWFAGEKANKLQTANP